MSDSFISGHVHLVGVPSSKVILSDNDDFRYFLALKPIPGPVGGHSLTITSQWDSSSKPQEEQVRFRACIDRAGLLRLQDLIRQELES